MSFITKKQGTLEYLVAEGITAPHCFTTRFGGVSQGHLASMNIGIHRGDDPANVAENYRILTQALGFSTEDLVATHQTHSDIVRAVGREDRGVCLVEGASPECDALVTNAPGVALVIYTADCTPILLCGEKEDGSPVISAVHAGWRGTAKGIAGKAVEAMCALGCRPESIKAAVGPHIGSCCYEVGGDLLEDVTVLRGSDFARRHITPSPHASGKFFCDMTGMNREILMEAGVPSSHIDVTDHCTYCMSDVYYSHRKTSGKRGAMGGGIVIL